MHTVKGAADTLLIRHLTEALDLADQQDLTLTAIHIEAALMSLDTYPDRPASPRLPN